MTLAAEAFNRHFWPAAKLAKMLDAMTLLDETPPRAIDVDFVQPHVLQHNGTYSRDYMVEYVRGDAPDLAEGARVSIDGTMYTVRQPPKVPDSPRNVKGGDGYFWQAILKPA